MQDSKTKYARSGDVNIAYKVFGSGNKYLIFIPGWISNVEGIQKIPQLAAWLRYLSTFRQVVVFDKRGTGLSDRVNEDQLPDLAQRTDDLLAVMAANNIQVAAILGLSEGGPMAIHFTATYPDRVSELVLFGAFAKWVRSDDYPFGMTRSEHKKVIDYMFAHWGEPIGLHLMAPGVSDDLEAQEQWATFLRHSASPSTAKAFYEMNLEIDVRDALKKVHKPTLILHREGDRLLECDHSKYLHEHIRGSTLMISKGSDHLPWFGSNHEELETLQTFLSDGTIVNHSNHPKLSPEDIMTLYNIRSYLENHFDEEISIMALSRNFAMNEFKIKGGFKKLFATPVITFLTERRLAYARELLSHGNNSVDSIAAAAGYQHRSNFSIAFKRKFGMTPIEYRKKLNASR